MTSLALSRQRNNSIILDALVCGLLGTLLLVFTYTQTLPFSNIEMWGFVTGATAVWLAVRNSVWSWPIGIVNAGLYVYIFLDVQLYADMTLQMYYVLMGFLGLYFWLKEGKGGTALPITHIPIKIGAALLVGTAAVVYGMTLYLRSIGDAAPFLDAMTASFSFTAQFMLARRWIENWLVWIGVDILSIGLYFWKDLPLTGVLYAVFLSMCVIAYFKWKPQIVERG